MARDPDITLLYRKRARNYDLYSQLFPLIGFRMESYRRYAIDSLNLKPGDTVIDLACGTGLNFPILERAVGKKGRIIGIDISKEMLSEARKKVSQMGWKNVELMNRDISKFEFPKKADGIITTYAITLVPEYDCVIKRGAQALGAGKRFTVLDFKKPKSWPGWLVRIAADVFVAPFGGSLDMAERHPWESMEKNLKLVAFREFFFGAVYLACGEKGA